MAVVEIGQTVQIPTYDDEENEVLVFGVVRGFDLGGLVVRVEIPVHPKPEIFEYLRFDIERWVDRGQEQ